MKIGDRFKDKATGKIYIFRMQTEDNTFLLEGENGRGRKLVGQQNLKQTCEKLEERDI